MRVHHTKSTISHIQVDIDIHTSCTMQPHNKKVNQTLPTFQRYGPTRYKKCKTDIVIPRECGPSKEQEKGKRGTSRGILIHALEKRLRKRDREETT